MSDGDRSGDDQVGLKRWLWPAIVFAVTILSYGGIQHWLHYDDAARNAANYARDAQNQISAECSVPLTDQNCAREIEQARRANQRQEYDLYAQKAMALWTGVMGAMAVIGIALSGVGVYLIWQTWKQTGDALHEATKTREAAVEQLRIAETQLNDTREAFQASHSLTLAANLPYVWIKAARVSVEGNVFEFRLDIENIGKTPAIEYQVFAVMRGDHGQSLSEGTVAFANKPVGAEWRPFYKVIARGMLGAEGSDGISGTATIPLKAGDDKIALFGIVTYQSVMGGGYFSKFYFHVERAAITSDGVDMLAVQSGMPAFQEGGMPPSFVEVPD